ncbi:uncharacterized protein J4E84_002422 [Alternaria hordeiaustralica]|uniref:uncharacterized protein n=1 Tax=Alternaria viburni TaxID=566460 RepID=UPI0020C235DA|nr:uncharacterized protein J4E79_004050 [Alternaria viburni]XP_049247070.1 uncharacterized protein J4E84_002422 [Alternaria hordeiaustralica]KAI4662741.1 hypothetical protein J4E79_004050 [Alternaria viburni]KAI4693846.1 hypothetical protein J4E84_002422 [Alternaria hordeiaustralica]
MPSTVPLYELCVPPLRKAMQNHLVVLKKGEQWCDENGYPHSKVLSARLAPDMHPLALQIFFQVTTATKALERLGGMEVPTFGFDAASFQDLYKQIEQALECFEKAQPEAFAGKEDMPVTIDVPNMWHFDLNGLTYLQEFVLPNL